MFLRLGSQIARYALIIRIFTCRDETLLKLKPMLLYNSAKLLLKDSTSGLKILDMNWECKVQEPGYLTSQQNSAMLRHSACQ